MMQNVPSAAARLATIESQGVGSARNRRRPAPAPSAYLDDTVEDSPKATGVLSLRVIAALQVPDANFLPGPPRDMAHTQVAHGLTELADEDFARMTRSERCFAHAVTDMNLAALSAASRDRLPRVRSACRPVYCDIK